jgi:hypothetical protein
VIAHQHADAGFEDFESVVDLVVAVLFILQMKFKFVEFLFCLADFAKYLLTF